MRAYRWRVCVEQDGEDDLIEAVAFEKLSQATVFSYGLERVDYDNHQSLPANLYIKDGPFQLTATSWRPTLVSIIVYFKSEYGQEPLRLQHLVEFDADADNGWDAPRNEMIENHAVHIGAKMESSEIAR